MATTETPIAQLPGGRILVYWTQTGPASYAAAGIPITINTLRKVEQVMGCDSDGGYRVSDREATNNISPTTPNQFNLPVHYQAYACPGASQTTVCATGFAVPTTTSLAATTFAGYAIGF